MATSAVALVKTERSSGTTIRFVESPTVNGVKAKGGAIDGPGAMVVKGMVFVNSGYSRFGGLPGNVLLAFERGE
jgi:hypothetical protein